MATFFDLITSSFTASNVFNGLIVLIATVVIGIASYRLTLHPLADIPGPRLWAITCLPFLYNLAIGRLHSRIHELHEEYGLIIRVAPGELSFITESSWSDIYLKPVGKPQLQKELAQYKLAEGAPGIVLEADDGHHSRNRKNFASGFTETAMRQQEPTVIRCIDQFISCIRERSSRLINIIEWYSFILFDIMGELIFGESFDSMQTSLTSEWAKGIFSYFAFIIVGGVMQKFWPFHNVLRWMLPDSVKRGAANHERATLDKLGRRLAKSEPPRDMITPLLESLDTPLGVSSAQLLATTRQLVLGASETSTSALGSITYILWRHPDTLARLTDEIRTSFATSADITKDEVNKLPYLNAVINEMFRLFPPVPGNLRHITPPEGYSISETYIPGNTIVGYDLWAGGRSAANFFQPNEFLPERYLPDAPEEFKNDNRKGHQPFSIGPRNCIGKNFALVEIRLIVAKLLWEFNYEVQKESQDWIQPLRAWGVFEKPPLTIKFTSVRE